MRKDLEKCIKNKHSAKKIFLLRQRLIVAFFFGMYIAFSAVFGNPVGGQVTSGNATITNSGTTTTINQTSDRAIINWQSFNIGRQETTHFEQPSNGIALNRISPLQGMSTIFGTLTATGKIVLINSSGIYFGPGAFVSVGGLIATTADITDQNFLSGNYQFVKAAPNEGFVINDGTIVARDHGLVALVAPGVVNNGMIQANLGHVILASGDAFTVNFSGDDLINFRIDAQTSGPGIDQNGHKLDSGVANNGKIFADGGQILVTAKAAEGVLDNVIDMNGIAVAKSVSEHDGEIILSGDGGVVKVAGKLDTSSKNFAKGGTIKVLGDEVYLAKGAELNASGGTGGGEILIGGDYQGKNPNIQNANYTYVDPNVNIYADALQNGNGGKVVVWSNLGTTFYGNIFARGGAESGNGGFVEVSGKDHLAFEGYVNGAAPHGKVGSLLLDPTNLFIVNGAAGTGDQDPNASSGTLTFSSPDTTNNTLSVGKLQSLGDINIDLQAKNTLTVGNSTGGSTQLDLSGSLFTGTLTLNAGDPTTVGGGNIVFNNGSTITTGGGSVNLIAGNVSQGTGNATLGAISTNGGDIDVTAQQGVTVNGALNSGSGAVNLTAGTGTLAVNQNITAQDNSINLSGAGITQAANTTINAAGVGTLSLNAGNNAITTNAGSSLLSLNVVSLSAGTMNLGGLQIGGDTLGDLANNVIFTGSNGESIGIAGGGGSLSLSSSALGTVNASDVRIGSSNAGAITIGSFNAGTTFAEDGTLTLDSGSSITQTGGLQLGSTTGLLLRDATSVVLNNSNNVIKNVAATIAGSLSIVNQTGSSLTVSGLSDDMGTVNGITAPGGVSLTTSGSNSTLKINQNISTTNNPITLTGNGVTQSGGTIINSGSGALALNAGANILTTGTSSELLSTGTVTLTGNSMLLSGSQIGGDASGDLASNVILQPGSSGISMGLAGGSGSISLTTARLNTIEASNVRVGNSTAGIIRIGAWTPLSTFAKNGVLTLDSGSQILQTGALNLGTDNAGLLIRDASNTLLTNSSNVLSNVAAVTSGSTSVTDANPLTITSLSDDLGTVNGITTNGATTLNSSGLLSINQNVNSTNNTISLTGSGITLASNKSVNAGSSNMTANVGTNTLTLNSGSDLLSSALMRITGDNMSFDPAAQIGGTGSGTGNAATVILQQSTAGRTIGIAGGTGSLVLSSAGLNDIRTTNLRIGNSSAGNMNIGTWTPAANVASNGVLTLDTGGTITQSGAMNLATDNAGLLLRDSSGVTLNNSSNVFNTVALTITGGLALNSASPFTVTSLTDDLGTVNGIATNGATTLSSSGLLSINQNVNSTNNTISLTGSGITLASNKSVNAGSSDMTVNAGTSTLTLNSGSDLLSSAAMTITGDNMSFDPAAQIGGTGSGAGNAATVILQQSTTGRTIGIAGGAGSLALSSAGLNDIRTTNLRIGNSSAGNMNIGTWTAASNVANNGVLTLDTGGTITQSGALNLASDNSGLLLRDASNVTLNNGGNMLNSTAVSINGGLALNSASPFTVTSLTDDLGTVNGIATNGATTLSSSGLLSINQNVNSTNNTISLSGSGITLASNKSTNAGSSNMTVNAGTGTLTLNSGSDLLSSAAMTITGDNMSFDPAAQIGGTSSGAGNAATVILQQSTAGRTIGIAGGAGSLALSSAGLNDIRTTNLRIGNISAGNVNIGTWTPGSNVASNGVLTLDTGGTITQSGPINLATNGAGLLLRDSSDVTLNNNNVFGNVALNISGGLALNSSSPFTVTSLTDDLGTVNGITTNGAISLNSSGLLNINQNVNSSNNTISLTGLGITLSSNQSVNAGLSNMSVNAGTNTLTLNSGSDLLSSAKMTITGDNMSFDPAAQIGGTGSGVGNAATVILQQSTAGRTIGIAGGAGSLALSSAGLNDIRTTNLRIGNSSAGNMNIGTWTPAANVATNGVLTLDTSGTMTQSGPINLATNGAGLILRDSSGVTLNNTSNVFGNMAVSINGGLVLRSAGPFSITTLTDDLGTVFGISANAAALATPATMAVNQNIATNGGDINLTGGGGISLGASLSSNGGNINSNSNVNLTGNSSVIGSNGGNVTLNGVSGGNNLTVNSGSSGNINFNGNSTFNTLNIVNANHVTNNGVINAVNYVQSAGNVTNFGSGSNTLNVTGNTNITVNDVIGNLTVANLTLNVPAANLFGTVGGSSGIPGILKIVNENSFSPGTHFFDGIDMFLTSNPSTPSTPLNNTSNIATVSNINRNFQPLIPTNLPQVNITVNNLPSTVAGVTAGALTNAKPLTAASALPMTLPLTAANALPMTLPLTAVQPSPSNAPQYALPSVMESALKSLEQMRMNQVLSLVTLLTLATLILIGARRRRVLQVAEPNTLEDVSFKLRTALNGINGFAELMYQEKAGAVSNEQKEFLADIMSSSGQLLNYMKDFSQTASARLRQEFMEKLSFKLRTALTGIKGFTELMHQGVAGEVTTTEKEYLDLMLSSSDEALQLI